MATYLVTEGKMGKRYLKDSRFISKDKIPPEIYTRLVVGVPTTDEELDRPDDKSCLLCGIWSKNTKTINGQTVYICEQDYLNTTTGKIAQAIREKELING